MNNLTISQIYGYENRIKMEDKAKKMARLYLDGEIGIEQMFDLDFDPDEFMKYPTDTNEVENYL